MTRIKEAHGNETHLRYVHVLYYSYVKRSRSGKNIHVVEMVMRHSQQWELLKISHVEFQLSVDLCVRDDNWKAQAAAGSQRWQ